MIYHIKALLVAIQIETEVLKGLDHSEVRSKQFLIGSYQPQRPDHERIESSSRQ